MMGKAHVRNPRTPHAKKKKLKTGLVLVKEIEIEINSTG